jgi:hypothetical protein
LEHTDSIRKWYLAATNFSTVIYPVLIPSTPEGASKAMDELTKNSLRWYKAKTVFGVAICVALGSCLRPFGAMFGANLLFEWLRQRDQKIQAMEAALGFGEALPLLNTMQELKEKAAAVEWMQLTAIDDCKSVCPICGTEFFSERATCFPEPQPCMNLQDIHPHSIVDKPSNPNPWAWSWYQIHGYKPPGPTCDRVYTPPESWAENPAVAMAAAGRVYWSEHRNHMWDSGYATPPQWYIDLWADKTLVA